MCTVTYVPAENGCFITSSRDEKTARPKALPPAFYQHEYQQLLYPKDTAANGSWITVSQSGIASVLLNGAFVKHIPKAVYRKSRGLILLEIVSGKNPLTNFHAIDLLDIEPFTLVLFFERQLFECRWDGIKKHVHEMKAVTRHIWSSATLYTGEVIAERKSWFAEWCAANPSPRQADIVNFHKFAGNGDIENSVLMNRSNNMLTVSITSIFAGTEDAAMLYYDLMEKGGSNERHIQFRNLATT